jgi:hypothetical protein
LTNPRPSLDEVIEYVTSKLGYRKSWAESWYKHTTAKNWTVKGAIIQDWKLAARKWIKTAYQNQVDKHTPPTGPADVIELLEGQGIDDATEKGELFYAYGERCGWANKGTGEDWPNWRGLALTMEENGDQLNALANR